MVEGDVGFEAVFVVVVVVVVVVVGVGEEGGVGGWMRGGASISGCAFCVGVPTLFASVLHGIRSEWFRVFLSNSRERWK